MQWHKYCCSQVACEIYGRGKGKVVMASENFRYALMFSTFVNIPRSILVTPL